MIKIMSKFIFCFNVGILPPHHCIRIMCNEELYRNKNIFTILYIFAPNTYTCSLSIISFHKARWQATSKHNKRQARCTFAYITNTCAIFAIFLKIQ